MNGNERDKFPLAHIQTMRYVNLEGNMILTLTEQCLLLDSIVSYAGIRQ